MLQGSEITFVSETELNAPRAAHHFMAELNEPDKQTQVSVFKTKLILIAFTSRLREKTEPLHSFAETEEYISVQLPCRAAAPGAL